jgi:predicted TIM-barrel fold metal-dependent hydrolase
MRVMFGSHRPISKLARNVARPYAAYEEGLSEAERDAVFRTNAARWFWQELDRGKVRSPESARDLV